MEQFKSGTVKSGLVKMGQVKLGQVQMHLTMEFDSGVGSTCYIIEKCSKISSILDTHYSRGILLLKITVFILIVFKILRSSKSNDLSFDQNHLIKNPILFCIYLSPQKLHRNGLVFEIYVWISVFRSKKQFLNPLHGRF